MQIEVLHKPIIELRSELFSTRLHPKTWKQFSYFKLLIQSSPSDTYIIRMDLDFSFVPFINFMNNDCKYIWKYGDILQLRESLLYFGLYPNSILQTTAELWIVEKVSLLFDFNSMWIVIQCGWDTFIDDASYGLGLSFIRQNKIKHLLNLALVPLSGDTIDVLSIEYLDNLKNREDLSTREYAIKKVIDDMFDVSKFPSPLNNFGYY